SGDYGDDVVRADRRGTQTGGVPGAERQGTQHTDTSSALAVSPASAFVQRPYRQTLSPAGAESGIGPGGVPGRSLAALHRRSIAADGRHRPQGPLARHDQGPESQPDQPAAALPRRRQRTARDLVDEIGVNRSAAR